MSQQEQKQDRQEVWELVFAEITDISPIRQNDGERRTWEQMQEILIMLFPREIVSAWYKYFANMPLDSQKG